MSARRDLPEPIAGRPFAVRTALEAGVPASRLRAADLRRPFHGVRVPDSDAEGFEQRCAALVTRFRAGDAFSGPTAARLHGMPIPARFQASPLLHVSSIAPKHPMRRRDVVGSLRGADVTIERSANLPTFAPLEAWFSLSGEVGLDALVAAGDFLVTGDRGRNPLVAIEELREFSARTSRRHGVERVRVASQLVRRGAWSVPETVVRLALQRAGLPEPRLNVVLPGSRFVPDLSWPEFRVALEYNGAYHDDREQVRRDLRRMESVVETGWSVVNVDRTDSPRDVVERTARRLASRGWRGQILWPKVPSRWRWD